VEIDPVQIDQILVNLCVNARDAIAKSGHVVIETDTSISTTNALLHSGACRRYAVLAVRDDGAHSAETLAKCSMPFFTPRDVGKGTAWVWRRCTASSSKTALHRRDERSWPRHAVPDPYAARGDAPKSSSSVRFPFSECVRSPPNLAFFACISIFNELINRNIQSDPTVFGDWNKPIIEFSPARLRSRTALRNLTCRKPSTISETASCRFSAAARTLCRRMAHYSKPSIELPRFRRTTPRQKLAREQTSRNEPGQAP
jgi:hypothetical protein